MSDLAEVRDKIDTAATLQSMYDLAEDVVLEIIGAASPYAWVACTLIDSNFHGVVDSYARRGGSVTPVTIQVLGELVEAVLHKAHENAKGVEYLKTAFFLLGLPRPGLPEELDYQRVLPAMWLLMPRLVAIRLESLASPQADQAAGEQA